MQGVYTVNTIAGGEPELQFQTEGSRQTSLVVHVLNGGGAAEAGARVDDELLAVKTVTQSSEEFTTLVSGRGHTGLVDAFNAFHDAEPSSSQGC